ncbi:VP3 [Rotavirus A]|uniref:Protein VP3 n=1 Tax=Rotavirus A TaxID=28875 RepID=A0A2D0W0Z2_9REOV|nr:VP3 [Rotavirus A]
MKVLALRHRVDHVYADTQAYTHDLTKDEYENAFLISNLTAHNILYYYYSVKTLEILNKSGITAIEIDTEDELILLIKSNFTYDFNEGIVYLHDYSYYTNNEIRTDQFWVTTTDIEEYIIPGWRVTYVGNNGYETRGHYNFSFVCQNAATDDDIIINYIYSNELNFQNYLLQKIKERMTTALPMNRLSNRIFREKMIRLSSMNNNQIINIGPRNESMFLFLNYPGIKHYSNGAYMVKDTLKLKQERWLGKRLSQFDIGQYKNMLNVLTTLYCYYDAFKSVPLIYMLGSAPSYWIKDVKNVTNKIKFETWDPLDTPYSDKHHRELFFKSDVNKLTSNSILYIDIRTDRGTLDWKEWRKRVEKETIENLDIAYEYLRTGVNKMCCVKITAMDIELPVTAKLIHHPTTEIRSECYLIMDHFDSKNTKRFIPKGTLYSYINNTLTENVFLQKQFLLKKTDAYVIALYALSNDMNDREKVVKFVNNTQKGIITVRLNNSFDDVDKVGFKNVYDWTFLPTDFSLKNTIRTSYDSCLGMFGLSISLESKPTGNNHIFIISGSSDYYNIDSYANHLSISRRSHQIRFSESATTLSGYIFRDLSNGNFNLIETNTENSVSGHVYNALIYFRYNYSFDLLRWIYLHSIDKVQVEGGKYYEHAPIELLYACESAIEFASIQNDLTVSRYAREVRKYINSVYSIVYADNPNYFIAITFVSIPYKYEVRVPHLTFGVLHISDTMIDDVAKIIRNLKTDIRNMNLQTNYTYMLTDDVYVANISGTLSTYFKLYNAFYREQIPFGQSRMYIPHVTLAFGKHKPVKIDKYKLIVKDIYLKKIHGDIVYTLRD